MSEYGKFYREQMEFELKQGWQAVAHRHAAHRRQMFLFRLAAVILVSSWMIGLGRFAYLKLWN